MEHLWSPWRSKYISTFKDDDNRKEGNCFICDAINANEFNDDNLVVFKNDLLIVLLNKYPYNAGHILIAPTEHIGSIEGLKIEVMNEINIYIKHSIAILDKLYKPQGYNIGVNIGRVAGAGLPDHIHYHIVPRWAGDTNFVTTISDIKVISEQIEEARINIANEFEKIR
ncbi:MAG TPA: HIT domain-containing protein [Candidatus Kapabacteria bacterium]|nr:HIT domain-containing protein [Candidatus Kapabacteria bacterium]